MLLPVLLMQASALVAPLYLDDQPPEARAVRAILVVHKDVPGVSVSVTRTREEAAAEAERLHEQLVAGADFAALARKHSGHQSAVYGGVLGSYFPGMLRGEADAFLFGAEPGELSAPLDTEIGYQLMQRIDARAGCLHILLQGDDQAERAAEIRRRLDEGADFGELARELSDDPQGRERGGQQAVFLRGPTDSLLKAAVFDVEVGEVTGPILSSLGTSIAKRVPVESIDPALVEGDIVQARAILLAAQLGRDLDRTEAFAHQLAARIEAGESMAELAALYDDDPGGRARAGNLGWVLRRSSVIRPVVERVFYSPRGELIGPLKIKTGWLLLRREQ